MKIKQIYEIGTKLLEPLTLEETYKVIVEEAIRLLRAEYGAIYLSENLTLQRMFTTMPTNQQVTNRKMGYVAQAFKSKRIQIVPTRKMKDIYPQFVESGVKAIVMLPLTYKKESYGVLTLQLRRKPTFTKADKKLLSHFSSIVTLGLRKAQLYNETKSALKQRDEFISSAAHELRTPLTSLFGYAQMIQKVIGANQMTKVKWIESMLVQIFRLERLVDTLLFSQEMEQKKLKYFLRRKSIVDVTEEAIKIFGRRFPNQKLEFMKDGINKEDLALIDEEKFIEVLINIMTNAAQNSPKKEPIQVQLSSVDRMLEIRVVDRGKGIGEEDMPYIFSKFYKSRKVFSEGLGLSLYVAKNIIDNHYGNIQLSSKKNKGTSVVIQLPKYKNDS